MHKLRKAAVVVAALGSIGLLGFGTAGAAVAGGADYSGKAAGKASARAGYEHVRSGGHGGRGHWGKSGHGRKWGGRSVVIRQSTTCRSHDANVDVLGQVGIANGLASNLLGGERGSGRQRTDLGSDLGCNNVVGR
ncbi:hypothetical protein [Streptomyces sp. NPDC048650]|uniref:hypothetical protein n=1 Tax=unclassified Streptomyces TaxID=2593676 RepID=UPI00371C116A